MARRSGFSIQERREGERNVWRAGLALSLLLHILVYVFWPTGEVPVATIASAGPRTGDVQAAGGQMEALNLRVEQRREITPPPVPTVTPDPVDMDFQPEPATNAGDVLGDRPASPGSGLPDAVGGGDGGTSEEGRYRRRPPSPRGMIMPPSNEELKGTRIQVWVFVDERGRVVPDSTRLEDNGEFNRRLLEEAAQWVFEPAREGGEPVAAWFPYTISM